MLLRTPGVMRGPPLSQSGNVHAVRSIAIRDGCSEFLLHPAKVRSSDPVIMFIETPSRAAVARPDSVARGEKPAHANREKSVNL